MRNEKAPPERGESGHADRRPRPREVVGPGSQCEAYDTQGAASQTRAQAGSMPPKTKKPRARRGSAVGAGGPTEDPSIEKKD
jgi:hypothetical protein